MGFFYILAHKKTKINKSINLIYFQIKNNLKKNLPQYQTDHINI